MPCNAVADDLAGGLSPSMRKAPPGSPCGNARSLSKRLKKRTENGYTQTNVQFALSGI